MKQAAAHRPATDVIYPATADYWDGIAPLRLRHIVHDGEGGTALVYGIAYGHAWLVYGASFRTVALNELSPVPRGERQVAA